MRVRWYLAGPLLAIAGGLVVWVGALLPWADTSVDQDDLRRALAETPDGARAVADLIDASYTWVEGVDAAAWMLIFTTAAVVLAAVLVSRPRPVAASTVALLGVVVGAVSYATRVDPAALAQQIETEADMVGGSGVWAGMPIAPSVIVDPGAGTAIRVAGAAMIVAGALLTFVIPDRDPPLDPSYIPWGRPRPDA